MASEHVNEQQVIDVMEPLGERAKEVVMTAGERLIQQGWQQGRQEGERDARLEVARKMLREGLSLEQVARVTDLTLDQLRKLGS